MESIEKAYQKAAKLKKQSRRLLLFAAMTAAMGTQLVSAQTFSEWFRQKSTQKKYLLEQVFLLCAFLAEPFGKAHRRNTCSSRYFFCVLFRMVPPEKHTEEIPARTGNRVACLPAIGPKRV